jgi:membrane protease YdiL (CAAX protease family)
MGATEVAMIVYSGLMLAFFVVFLIGYFRYRKRVRPYARYALIPAVALVLIEGALLVCSQDIREAVRAPVVLCVDVIAFVRLFVYGAVGMYCAASVARPYAPLLRALVKHRPQVATGLSRGLLFWAPVFVGASVVYSWLLFTLVPVRMSEAIREMLEASPASAPLALQPSLVGALVMLEFALAEEVMFRLGIQNYLAHVFKLRGDRYWVAILLTTVLWSVAHVNTLEPGWVKLVQVFPMGLALGLLFRRYGLEVCVLGHAVFNIIMMFLAPSLIQM